MANIKITVEGPLMDGHKITFKAPCNCNVVEKLDVRYIDDNTQKSKLFTMKDSHGNDLTGLGNLFSQGAYVDVVLDPNSGSAYLQNAGTNGYIEQKLKIVGTPVDNLESDRADLPLSARQGKILNNSLGGFKFKSTNGKKQVSVDGGSTWENFSSGAELLWTNPAPNTDFAPQTISLNLSNYTHVAIEALYTSQGEPNDTYTKTLIEKNTDGYISAYRMPDQSEFERRYTQVKNDRIVFDSGLYAYNGVYINNSACVPKRIWGLNIEL